MRLVIVGDGAQRQALGDLLGASAAREHVWFAGERSDVPDIMRGLDCFVLPSRAEGVSNTILEAMASRLPVVATSVGGNPELIESGMTGQLVPAGDSEALARAMLTYFKVRSMARRHAKAARRVVESRFSLKRMVADYTALYERSLAAAGIALPSGAQALAAR
jgi:glycosyltransferase involved in cell wall biosynthesis